MNATIPTGAATGANIVTHRTPATDAAYLTKHQVAAKLQVTPRFIELLVGRGKLPHIKIGRKIVRFRWSDVESALTQVN